MNSNCESCGSSKTSYSCKSCNIALCKSCSVFTHEDEFSFLETMPEEIKNAIYCSSCYQRLAEPIVLQYKQKLKQAENINVFFSNQGKETRLIKRTEAPLNVENCTDREEALLRLAFKAVEKGYNTLVDTEVNYKKIREGGRQRYIWSATGVPVNTQKK